MWVYCYEMQYVKRKNRWRQNIRKAERDFQGICLITVTFCALKKNDLPNQLFKNRVAYFFFCMWNCIPFPSKKVVKWISKLLKNSSDWHGICIITVNYLNIKLNTFIYIIASWKKSIELNELVIFLNIILCCFLNII